MLLVAMETGVSSDRVKLKNMRNMEKSIIYRFSLYVSFLKTRNRSGQQLNRNSKPEFPLINALRAELLLQFKIGIISL